MNVVVLPEFQGYTVDVRLKEFRRLEGNMLDWEFIPFDSPQGQKLFIDWLMNDPEARQEFDRVFGRKI